MAALYQTIANRGLMSFIHVSLQASTTRFMLAYKLDYTFFHNFAGPYAGIEYIDMASLQPTPQYCPDCETISNWTLASGIYIMVERWDTSKELDYKVL